MDVGELALRIESQTEEGRAHNSGETDAMCLAVVQSAAKFLAALAYDGNRITLQGQEVFPAGASESAGLFLVRDPTGATPAAAAGSGCKDRIKQHAGFARVGQAKNGEHPGSGTGTIGCARS